LRALFGLVLAACLTASSTALAATEMFEAQLTGHAESPPTKVVGKGVLVATLDTETRLLSYTVKYAGLSGPATMARFHGPAKGGQTAPPIIVVSDPASPISGHAALSAAQVFELEKGLWYFNVQTAANPDGEIRGQVKRRVDEEEARRAPDTGWPLPGAVMRSPGVDPSGVCGDHPCRGQ
jgi:hypothetical protein